MTTIGMLHHRLNPETVLKSYAFAAVAKAEGVDFFYFTPRRVNFESRTIQAKVLEDGQWQERTVPFPDVIYNAGSPEKLAVSKVIINKLKKEIPFTTHSIGNKWSISRRLLEAGDFAHFLIPTTIVGTVADFFKATTEGATFVLKPVDGRKGKGIYFITKEQNGYAVQKDTDVTRYTKQQLEPFLQARLAEEAYIVQPYIRSRLASGQVFDFRVHVQKNGTGDWTILTVYPRVAPTGSSIPNINNGGYTNYLEPFLAHHFPEKAFDIQRTLEQFGLALARHLDDIQMKKFGEVIDEIGIDVGMDARGKLWIYEVNWRPGCPPTFYLELDVVRNTIGYAVYLANNQEAVKEKIRLAQSAATPKKDRPIIAITGSAGKTTTKAFLASMLSTRLNVFQSKDYWNTTEHTKQHAELITAEHDAVVLEYGMAYPGVIREHCAIIQPNMSIITNIGLAHVGNFDGKIEGVAQAKSELIHGMTQNGLLIVNADDDNSKLLETAKFKGKILTVGMQREADYRASDVHYEKDGMRFKVKLGGKEVDVYIPILGEHHVYNALSAIAVADQLGLSVADIVRGANFKKPPRRLTLYHLRQQITVIDDTVHSHPQGARAAIDVLKNSAKKRTIAIIGQMRELGDLREAEYEKLGAYIAEQKIDVLITYGFRTEEIGAAAREAGMKEGAVHHFLDREKLHAFLQKLVKRGDTVLVKGASKTNMFETVRFLDTRWGK